MGDCKDNCCSGVMTSNTEFEYWSAPNIQGEPIIVPSSRCLDPVVAYGHNTKVILNGKVIPWVTEFNCSEKANCCDITCVLLENTLSEIECGGELKVLTIIGEKEIVLFEEKVYVFDKMFSCNAEKNLVQVTIMFEKLEEQ
jgi:hypothetical protein